MMRRFPKTARALITITGVLAPACASSGTETDNPADPDGVHFLRSSLPYQIDVEVSAADRDAIRAGNRAFALSLYGEVASLAVADENLFLGPHSVATVLAMTSAGARGTTATEFDTVMQSGLSQDALHPAMNQLAQEIRQGLEGTAVRYDALNSVWLAADHGVDGPFLDVLGQHYDAGTYLVDFAGDPAGARQAINDWVADQTQGLIPELFAAGALDPTTELALTNAAYLSAPWQDRFDPESTKPAEFTLFDGTVVEVPMMDRLWEYPSAFDVDWRALELPFRDAEMGMIFVLPNAGEYAEFEATFDASVAERIVFALESKREEPDMIWAQVPRFDFSSDVDLRPALEALGMTTAFQEQVADFTGIDPDSGLYIDAFTHRTTVGVDENGTTAAVATGEVMVPSPITPHIRLDRPFLFFVYDHHSESVLFVGRLVRPAGEARPPSETPNVETDAGIICRELAACQERTTTEAECLAALAGDDPEVLEQCADCIAVGAACVYSNDCARAQFCQPATCADYCPAHEF